MKRSLRLSPVTSLTPLIGNGELVAFSVGPDGVVYLVVALKHINDGYETFSGASFSKTILTQPQRYRVVGLYGSQPIVNVVIEDERSNIDHVQPLVDELLLVSACTNYKGPDNFEKNGRVYTRDGKFTREFLLGDGIESVQATSGGVIWTSYFDEGVVRTFGWPKPVGESGLVAWDSAGTRLYEFEPSGLDKIIDCYALNVESEDDVWLYYYTDFPLVHLYRRQIQSVWKIGLEGSHAFAVSHGYALFSGSYDDRDTFYLFDLSSGGKPNLAAEIELQDQNGSKLVANRVIGRADAIYLINDDSLYRVEVQTVIAEVRKG